MLINHDIVVISVLGGCMHIHTSNYCHDNWDLKTGADQYQEKCEVNMLEIMIGFTLPHNVLKKRKRLFLSEHTL